MMVDFFKSKQKNKKNIELKIDDNCCLNMTVNPKELSISITFSVGNLTIFNDVTIFFKKRMKLITNLI